jgi:hypothetical protein
LSTTEKPDPARAALFLAQLVTDAEAKRRVGLSDEEFLAEQKRKGRDLSQTPSAEEFLERVKVLAARRDEAATAPAVPDTRPTAPVRAMPQRRRLVWLLAAAAIPVAVVVSLSQGPEIVGHFHPDPHEHPRELAEKLRDDAIGICEQGGWGACKSKLDEAARLDPAGESEPRVQKARAEIESAERPGPKGSEGPGK